KALRHSCTHTGARAQADLRAPAPSSPPYGREFRSAATADHRRSCFGIISAKGIPSPGRDDSRRDDGAAPSQGSLRGSQACDRYPVRRAGDIVEPGAMAKPHRVGIATMLATDTELQIRSCRATAVGPDLHQLSDALLVE